MKIHVFEGLPLINGDRTFGFAEEPTGSRLPPEHAPWRLVKEVDLDAEERWVGVDAAAVKEDIARDGYHVVGASRMPV